MKPVQPGKSRIVERRTPALLPLFLLFASTCLVSCGGPREETLAITHVTVIDMTGDPPRLDQTVLLAGEHIAALGAASSIRVASGTPVVDASGKFLIPGLADMHVHLTAAGEPDGSRKFMLPLLVANGVTTVRDMGGYLESLVPLRQEISAGKRLGPAIFYAGPYLDGSPPSFEPSFVVTDRTQASEDVRQLLARGVDFIKVQSRLSREAYFAIAEAARREHIRFVGHVPDRVTAEEAAGAGQHSIEHLTNILRGCSLDEARLMREQFFVPPGRETPAQAHARISRWLGELLDSYSRQKAEALAARFVANDVWQTPTLVLLKNNAFPTFDRPPAFDQQYVPRPTLERWKTTRAAQMRLLSPADAAVHARLFSKSAELVGQMQKAGVPILAGSDSPAPYVIPGFALHQELQLLVEAGLTPMRALQSATRDAAEFLGTSKKTGTVEAGKYADLVVLDASPLDDIGNTRKIRSVIVRGQLLDRPALDALLASARSFASRN